MTKMDLRLSKFQYSCPYRAGDLRGEIPESWDCIDCGINSAPGSSTEPRWNKPMTADWNKQGVKQTVDNWSEVKPPVWKAAGMGEMDGCLCIGCLDAEGLPPQRSLQLNARHQAAAGTARRHLITTSGAALQIAARFMQILSRAPAVTRSAPPGPIKPAEGSYD